MAWHSVHIGLPSNRPNLPPQYEGPVVAGEFCKLAQSRGAVATLLTGRDATCAKVIGALESVAERLREGDRLLVTFTGHGEQIEDESEPGGYDQAWLLADDPLKEDDLRKVLQRLPEGVDVFILADHCFSAGMLRTSQRPVRRLFPPLGGGLDEEWEDGTLGGRTLVLAACTENRTALFGVLSFEAVSVLRQDPDLSWERLVTVLRGRYTRHWGINGPYVTRLRGRRGPPELGSRVLA